MCSDESAAPGTAQPGEESGGGRRTVEAVSGGFLLRAGTAAAVET